MSIITTITRKTSAAAVTTSMSIITIMRKASAAAVTTTMSIITTITRKTSAAAVTTTMSTIIMTTTVVAAMTTITIMPTRSSPPGVWKLPRSSIRHRSRMLCISWTPALTAWCSVPRVS